MAAKAAIKRVSLPVCVCISVCVPMRSSCDCDCSSKLNALPLRAAWARDADALPRSLHSLSRCSCCCLPAVCLSSTCLSSGRKCAWKIAQQLRPGADKAITRTNTLTLTHTPLSLSLSQFATNDEIAAQTM